MEKKKGGRVPLMEQYTLKLLVDLLRTDMTPMIRQRVGSLVDVLNIVRGQIRAGEFWRKVEEAGMGDLIVLLDGIENLRYIFLRVSETETKEIIQIHPVIDYYDNASPENGGVLEELHFDLVGLGKDMQDASLVSLVASARLSTLKEKKASIEAEITMHEEALVSLKQEKESLIAEMERLGTVLQKEEDKP